MTSFIDDTVKGLQLFFAIFNTTAARSTERNDDFSVENVVFQECIDNTGCLSPPNRIANQNHIITAHILNNPFSFSYFLFYFSDDPGRNAGCNHIRRYILCHYRSCGDHGIISNGDAREHGSIRTNPDVLSYMDWCRKLIPKRFSEFLLVCDRNCSSPSLAS